MPYIAQIVDVAIAVITKQDQLRTMVDRTLQE